MRFAKHDNRLNLLSLLNAHQKKIVKSDLDYDMFWSITIDAVVDDEE